MVLIPGMKKQGWPKPSLPRAVGRRANRRLWGWSSWDLLDFETSAFCGVKTSSDDYLVH
jgi:hypothetical protein